MNRFICVLSLAAAAITVTPRESHAQGRYEFRGRVYKLQPFPTDYHAPDKHYGTTTRAEVRRQTDLTAMQSAVKDQGARGSCAYFAAIGLVEHAIKKYYDGQKELNLSEEYMIYYAKAVLGWSSIGDGSNLSSNLASMRRGGFLLEEHMPYTHTWFAADMPCADEDEDTCRRVECFAHYAPSQEQLAHLVSPNSFYLGLDSNCTSSGCSDKLDWIVANLGQQKVVALGLPLHQDGWNGETGEATYTDEQAQYCEENPSARECGGHAIVLVGYDLDSKKFLLKNSWGHDWGNSGYGTIGFDYVDNYTRRGSIQAATISGLDPSLENEPPEMSLDNVTHDIAYDYVQDNEAGMLLRLMFEYSAPRGTYFYSSVFAMLNDGDDNYEPIMFTDEEGNSEYIAARKYTVALSPNDLNPTGENPLEYFIPYSSLLQAGVTSDSGLHLRPSVYSMSDFDTYVVLFREFPDVDLPASYPCIGTSWGGRCDGQIRVYCSQDGELSTEDCMAQDKECLLDEGTDTYQCVW